LIWGWKRPVKNGLAGAKPPPSADGKARQRGAWFPVVLRIPVDAFLRNSHSRSFVARSAGRATCLAEHAVTRYV